VMMMMMMMMMQAKTAELNALNVKLDELVRSSVEKDSEAGTQLSDKMKSVLVQCDKLSSTVDKRIKFAANNLTLQKRVKQVICVLCST